MDSTDAIREFLGWCTVINLGVLTFAALFVMLAPGFMTGIHGRLYGLGEDDLKRAYFQYLANYKIGIFIFNLAPYIALRVAG